MKSAGLEALHSLLICSANKGFAVVQEALIFPQNVVEFFAGHEGCEGMNDTEALPWRSSQSRNAESLSEALILGLERISG